MRRAELVAAVQNVLDAIEESRVWEVMDDLRISLSEGRFGGMSAEFLEAFQKYSVLRASFGRAEEEILDILDLEPLVQSSTWIEITQDVEVASSFRAALFQTRNFLPKFIKLLEQEYVEEVKSGSEDLPTQLQGKTLLTVVLPEVHGQFSTAKRVGEIISAISTLYESFVEIHQESQEPLVILSCDSGSDKSFDFLGVAKAVESVKDIILSVWDRVVLYREHQYAERLKLITNGMLPAIERISDLENEGRLGREQAGKIKKQIEDAIFQFLETGATIPEMDQVSKFEPRLLMGTEPKLLIGTPEPESTAVVEVKEQYPVDGLTSEELEQLEKLLQKARRAENKKPLDASEESSNDFETLPDDSEEPDNPEL